MAYHVEIEYTPETLKLMYLAYLSSLDPVKALVLYEKFGKDVFFIFCILGGEKVQFPRISRMEKIMGDLKTIKNEIDDPTVGDERVRGIKNQRFMDWLSTIKKGSVLRVVNIHGYTDRELCE